MPVQFLIAPRPIRFRHKMGRKAKKRIKVAAHPLTRSTESVGETGIEMSSNEEEELMEVKRLKETNAIDLKFADLGSSDRDDLSLSDELDIEGDDVDILSDNHANYHNKVSHAGPCHSDSDIMKSDIFDYEIHTNLGDYGAPFLNGIDSEVILDVKHEPPPSSSAPASCSTSLMGSDSLPYTCPGEGEIVSGSSAPDQSNQPPLTTSSVQLNNSVNGLVGTFANSSLDAPASCHPSSVVGSTVNPGLLSVVPGAIPINPVFLPNIIGSVGAANTALAHISKIEPGADGKGYVLHLTIPALGLNNVMLSTEGLTFAHQDPKLPSGVQSSSAAATDSGDDQCYQSPRGGEADSPGEINVDTDSPSPISYPSDENPMGDSASDLGLCTSELPLDGKIDSIEEETFHSGVGSFMDMASDIAHGDTADILGSPDQGSGGIEPSYGKPSAGLRDSPEPTEVKLTTMVEHNNIDHTEVDRFVICSDGPMVCVLCAFKTESYSAFKSHIICSHPCWRITKKLSKNRLLVEKSVKMNTSLNHTNFNMSQSICGRKSSETRRDEEVKGVGEAELKLEGIVHKESDLHNYTHGSSSSIKVPKRVSLHPRKRHLIERNKRLFRCTKCLRLFVFEGSIVNHLNDFHSISKPYDYIMVSNDHGQSFGNIHRCPHKNCFVTCTSELEVEKHRVESHAQVVFRCQICGLAADNADAIQTHVASIHQQQMKDYSVSD